MSALLSALFAGVVAIGVTVAVERLGGRLGGVIATAPTTIVPASLGFYAHSQDAAQLRAALAIAPMGMLCNALFLWTWRVVPPRLPAMDLPVRLVLMTVVSLCAWATAGTVGLAVLRAVPADALLPVGAAFVAASTVAGAWACRSGVPAPAGRRPVRPIVLVARGVLAAVAVGLAVAIVRVAGPFVAGLASVFPAIFLTTMVALWWSQGEAVPAGAVGPMMLGSASVGAYAIFAALLLPELGPAGAAVAWGLAVASFTLPAAWWLQRR